MAESPSLDSVALQAYDEDINPVSDQFETKIVVLTPPHSPFRQDGNEQPTPHRAAELQGNELYVYNHNSHARQSERFIQLMIVSKFLTRWKQLYLAHRYDEFCTIRRAWYTWVDSVARIQLRRAEMAPFESTAIVSKQLASHLLQAPYDVKQHQLPKPPQSIRVIDSMAALSDANVYSASYPSNDDLQQVGYRQPTAKGSQTTAAPRGGKTPKQSTVKHYMTPLTAKPRLSSITAKLFAADEPKRKVSSSITTSVVKSSKQRGTATAAAAAPSSVSSVVSGKTSQASSKRTPLTSAGPSITSHIHRAPPFCAMIPSDRIVPAQGAAAATAATATVASPSSSSPPAHHLRRNSPPPRKEPQALLNHPFEGSSAQPVPVFFPHHPLVHLQGVASPESALTGTTTSFFPDVDGALRAMPMTMVMVPNQALLFALSNQASSVPPAVLTATTAAQTTIAPVDGSVASQGGDARATFPPDRSDQTPVVDIVAVETQTVSDATVFTDVTVPAPPRRSASPSLVHSEARTHQLQQAALPTSSEPPPVMESVPSRAHRRLLAKRRLLTGQDQAQRRLQLQRVNAKATVEDSPSSSAVPATADTAAPAASVPPVGPIGSGGGQRKPNPLQRALLRAAVAPVPPSTATGAAAAGNTPPLRSPPVRIKKRSVWLSPRGQRKHTWSPAATATSASARRYDRQPPAPSPTHSDYDDDEGDQRPRRSQPIDPATTATPTAAAEAPSTATTGDIGVEDDGLFGFGRLLLAHTSRRTVDRPSSSQPHPTAAPPTGSIFCLTSPVRESLSHAAPSDAAESPSASASASASGPSQSPVPSPPTVSHDPSPADLGPGAKSIFSDAAGGVATAVAPAVAAASSASPLPSPPSAPQPPATDAASGTDAIAAAAPATAAPSAVTGPPVLLTISARERRQQYYQRSEHVEQEAAARYQRYRQLHFLHALRRHVDRSTFQWQLIQRSKQYHDQYTRSEAIAHWLRFTRVKQQRRQRMLQSRVPLFVTKLLVSSTETIVAYLEVMAMRKRLRQWRQWTRRQRPSRLKCAYIARIVDEERLFHALKKWQRYRDRGDSDDERDDDRGNSGGSAEATAAPQSSSPSSPMIVAVAYETLPVSVAVTAPSSSIPRSEPVAHHEVPMQRSPQREEPAPPVAELPPTPVAATYAASRSTSGSDSAIARSLRVAVEHSKSLVVQTEGTADDDRVADNDDGGSSADGADTAIAARSESPPPLRPATEAASETATAAQTPPMPENSRSAAVDRPWTSTELPVTIVADLSQPPPVDDADDEASAAQSHRGDTDDDADALSLSPTLQGYASDAGASLGYRHRRETQPQPQPPQQPQPQPQPQPQVMRLDDLLRSLRPLPSSSSMSLPPAAVEDATTDRHLDYDSYVVDLPLHVHDRHGDDSSTLPDDDGDDARRGQETPSPMVIDLSHPTPPPSLPPSRSPPSAAHRPPTTIAALDRRPHRSPSPTFSDDGGDDDGADFDAADYDVDYDRYAASPYPASSSFVATAAHEQQPPPLREEEAAEAAEAALLDLYSSRNDPWPRGPAPAASTEDATAAAAVASAAADPPKPKPKRSLAEMEASLHALMTPVATAPLMLRSTPPQPSPHDTQPPPLEPHAAWQRYDYEATAHEAVADDPSLLPTNDHHEAYGEVYDEAYDEGYGYGPGYDNDVDGYGEVHDGDFVAFDGDGLPPAYEDIAAGPRDEDQRDEDPQQYGDVYGDVYGDETRPYDHHEAPYGAQYPTVLLSDEAPRPSYYPEPQSQPQSFGHHYDEYAPHDPQAYNEDHGYGYGYGYSYDRHPQAAPQYGYAPPTASTTPYDGPPGTFALTSVASASYDQSDAVHEAPIAAQAEAAQDAEDDEVYEDDFEAASIDSAPSHRPTDEAEATPPPRDVAAPSPLSHLDAMPGTSPMGRRASRMEDDDVVNQDALLTGSSPGTTTIGASRPPLATAVAAAKDDGDEEAPETVEEEAVEEEDELLAVYDGEDVAPPSRRPSSQFGAAPLPPRPPSDSPWEESDASFVVGRDANLFAAFTDPVDEPDAPSSPPPLPSSPFSTPSLGSVNGDDDVEHDNDRDGHNDGAEHSGNGRWTPYDFASSVPTAADETAAATATAAAAAVASRRPSVPLLPPTAAAAATAATAAIAAPEPTPADRSQSLASPLDDTDTDVDEDDDDDDDDVDASLVASAAAYHRHRCVSQALYRFGQFLVTRMVQRSVIVQVAVPAEARSAQWRALRRWRVAHRRAVAVTDHRYRRSSPRDRHGADHNVDDDEVDDYIDVEDDDDDDEYAAYRDYADEHDEAVRVLDIREL